MGNHEKCNTGHEGLEYLPPSISLILNHSAGARSQRSGPLLGHLECSLHVYNDRKESTSESSTCLKIEYLKPTGLTWGPFNNIAIFRAQTHTK